MMYIVFINPVVLDQHLRLARGIRGNSIKSIPNIVINGTTGGNVNLLHF